MVKKGWKGESARHSLAKKGIKTKRYIGITHLPINYTLHDTINDINTKMNILLDEGEKWGITDSASLESISNYYESMISYYLIKSSEKQEVKDAWIQKNKSKFGNMKFIGYRPKNPFALYEGDDITEQKEIDKFSLKIQQFINKNSKNISKLIKKHKNCGINTKEIIQDIAYRITEGNYFIDKGLAESNLYMKGKSDLND